jgi:DNA transformation protein
MDADTIRDLFAKFRPVSVRRMFGGQGIYADGVMFALVHDDLIYLKADGEYVRRFETEGCRAFVYRRKDGARAVMSYWQMPERLYDDPDELATWAERAHLIASHAAHAKSSSPKNSFHKTSTKIATKPRSAARSAGKSKR